MCVFWLVTSLSKGFRDVFFFFFCCIFLYQAILAREWVAGGLRVECVAEAEEQKAEGNAKCAGFYRFFHWFLFFFVF